MNLLHYLLHIPLNVFITNSLCSRLCILTQNYTNSLKLYKLYSGSLPTFGKKTRRIIGMPNHETESIWSPYFVDVLYCFCLAYRLIFQNLTLRWSVDK